MQDLTVVKVGGKVVEEREGLASLLAAFAAIPAPKILVHGGGRSATALATRLGIDTKMVEGRRITDEPMLEVVTMVYGGLVNKKIVAGLQAMGQNAIGITGADLDIIRSRKRGKGDIDYGFVGDVETVAIGRLASLIGETAAIPVIAPLTHDGNGNLLNTNADTIASEVAAAISKIYRVTLVFCFELKGVLSDVANPGSVIPLITPATYKELKEKRVIVDGMIPKLDNGFAALEKGVSQIRITNVGGLATGNEGTLLRI